MPSRFKKWSSLTNLLELKEPSKFAFLLWFLGFPVIAATIYVVVKSRGWTERIEDMFLVFVAFMTGITAIATGA